MNLRLISIVTFFVFGAIFLAPLSPVANAAIQDEISAKQRQIEDIQRQIAEFQSQLHGAKSQSATLQQQIAKLNNEINQINLEIRSLELSISKTNLEIDNTQNKILDSEAKMNKHKTALAELIKGTYESNRRSMTEILLSSSSISEMFRDLNNIQSSQENLKNVINEIRSQKEELEAYNDELGDKRSELEQLRRLEELERKGLSSSKAQVNNLLKVTKGEETKYQQLVTQKQRDLEAIRAEISYLQKNGVSAEDAVKYAELAAIRSGIRPAFLLAELEQESGMGSNVGKCTIVNESTGSTQHVTTGKVFSNGIHPTRDLALFIKIVTELGRTPSQTVISCPSSGGGYGGAMGPAQFIPSTWMGYRDRVAAITGHAIPDPWSVEDAFSASAIKLANDGADSKTREGEIAASKRYYCGNSKSTNSGCINYANNVQRIAARIEASL